MSSKMPCQFQPQFQFIMHEKELNYLGVSRIGLNASLVEGNSLSLDFADEALDDPEEPRSSDACVKKRVDGPLLARRHCLQV